MIKFVKNFIHGENLIKIGDVIIGLVDIEHIIETNHNGEMFD